MRFDYLHGYENDPPKRLLFKLSHLNVFRIWWILYLDAGEGRVSAQRTFGHKIRRPDPARLISFLNDRNAYFLQARACPGVVRRCLGHRRTLTRPLPAEKQVFMVKNGSGSRFQRGETLIWPNRNHITINQNPVYLRWVEKYSMWELKILKLFSLFFLSYIGGVPYMSVPKRTNRDRYE